MSIKALVIDPFGGNQTIELNGVPSIGHKFQWSYVPVPRVVDVVWVNHKFIKSENHPHHELCEGYDVVICLN